MFIFSASCINTIQCVNGYFLLISCFARKHLYWMFTLCVIPAWEAIRHSFLPPSFCCFCVWTEWVPQTNHTGQDVCLSTVAHRKQTFLGWSGSSNVISGCYGLFSYVEILQRQVFIFWSQLDLLKISWFSSYRLTFGPYVFLTVQKKVG